MPYDAGTWVVLEEHWPNGKTKHKKWNDGEEHFYNEVGDLHREDGPAVFFAWNEYRYYLNGVWLKDIKSNEELIIKLIIE